MAKNLIVEGLKDAVRHARQPRGGSSPLPCARPGRTPLQDLTSKTLPDTDPFANYVFRVQDRAMFSDTCGTAQERDDLRAVFGNGPFIVLAVINHSREFAVLKGVHHQQVFVVPEHDQMQHSTQMSAAWLRPVDALDNGG